MTTPTLKQIRNEIEKLRARASQIENEERKTAIKTIKSLVVQFNLTAKDIGLQQSAREGKRSNRSKTARYQKGDLTWSGGRGVKPKWVHEIIEKQGLAALEQYRIKGR